MREKAIPEEMRFRHPICVRWDDADHKLIVDAAWSRRMRISELIRQIVLESLRPTVGGQDVERVG